MSSNQSSSIPHDEENKRNNPHLQLKATQNASTTTSNADDSSETLQQESHQHEDAIRTPKSYPAWHNFVAGGVAGAGSRVATAPLDLIRIRRQLSPPVYPSESLWQSWSQIVKHEGGVTALFRGNTAAINLWVGYAAIQFSLYNKTRDYFTSQRNWPASAASFGAGATAGTCATLATYPFDVCRTTFAARGIIDTTTTTTTNTATMTILESTTPASTTSATAIVPETRTRTRPLPFSSLVEPHYQRGLPSTAHLNPTPPPPLSSATPSTPPTTTTSNAPPKTMTEFVWQLYRQKGIRGFYAGAGPAVLQIVPYMGLNFMIYDALVADNVRVQNSGYAGALSGATSKLLVYPIDTVKRRLQAQAFYDPSAFPRSSRNRHYTSMWDCIVRISKEEGWTAFYRGVVPSVLKTTIASSLSFALFRFAKNTAEWAHDWNA